LLASNKPIYQWNVDFKRQLGDIKAQLNNYVFSLEELNWHKENVEDFYLEEAIFNHKQVH
jgi:hypothetical protein